jgi:hypothetical protein
MSLSARVPQRAYGEELASNYGADAAPHMVTRVLRRAELAVTELLVDRPPGRIGDLIPRQDAYMVCCQLREKERRIRFRPFEPAIPPSTT